MEPITWTGDNGETFVFEYVENHEHFERPVFVAEVKDSPLATEDLPTFFMAVETIEDIPLEQQQEQIIEVMKAAYESELEAVTDGDGEKADV